MVEQTTRGITVAVDATFAPERSDPVRKIYVYFYTVTITNGSLRPCRILGRRWTIIDGDGRIEQLNGPGVVGIQPLLGVGESFQYTSACPLRTPVGSMQGGYLVLDSDGDSFEAEINAFVLVRSRDIN
jgi:ApaG protein